MCGIAGFLDRGRKSSQWDRESLARRMADAIAHRGPDADGVYAESDTGIAFSHRRLSILDLSPAGAQPMLSADSRWVICFNGEIYNFHELRAQLDSREPRNWRGHSDTEVLAEAIASLGVTATLGHLNGMFAFAAWDRKERCLYLARDRMGEKPLYFGWAGDTFLFGSELKALAAHPAFTRKIAPAAVSHYLAYGYVPNPFSIYEGIFQLKPGHYLKMDAGIAPGVNPEPRPYWTLPVPQPESMEAQAAIEELDALLGDAVRLRMRADVPMGAFLSGGIDSSAIVGVMQANSTQRVRSYAIGFHESAYDESRHARAVAEHIGTEHTEMHVTSQDALDVIPALPQLYDEPLADASQIPTYLLCKLTRQHVTVSLSGDAGDELFGGYGRYFDFQRRWARRNPALDAFRTPAAALLNAVPTEAWSALSRAAPQSMRHKLLPHRARRIASAVGARSADALYRHLTQLWTPNMLRRPETVRGTIFAEQTDVGAFGDPFLGLLYKDMGSYLPDDILVKVDRASMAVALESRVPLLDHRIVEFAARLPMEMKQRDGAGKWILRRVLDRYVPRALIERPKQGFGIPIHDWLRGELRAWGEDLVNDRQTVIGDLIDMTTIRAIWEEHQQRQGDHGYRLWAILQLIAWARAWKPS